MKRGIRETLEIAVEHHRAGRLNRAEALYRKVLEVDPEEADALHLLGVIANQRGRFDLAERRVRRAITARGSPQPEFSHTLGDVLIGQHRWSEAVAAFDESLALKPDDADVHWSAGNVLATVGRIDEAARHFQEALRLRPGEAKFHCALGSVLLEKRMYKESMPAFRKAIELDPKCASAWCNLGHALDRTGQAAEALLCLGRALALQPDSVPAYDNLGCLLHQQGRLGDAVSCLETAAGIEPRNAIVHNNLANAFKELLRFRDAIAEYGKAIEIQPDFYTAVWNRSLALFLDGQIERAWLEYESGWKAGTRVPQRWFPQPWWDGTALAGRTLLYWGEQGLGDEMIFASMIPDLVSSAAHCVVECEARLVPLFARSFPGAEVVARTAPPQPATVAPELQIPAGSAGRWLRPALDRFPRHDGYLRADPGRVDHWRQELSALPAGLRIGICWRTGLIAEFRGLHSTELRFWAPVLAVRGAQFVNLQYDECRPELEQARALFGAVIHEPRNINLKQDIDEVAALISALDLVISVATLGGLPRRRARETDMAIDAHQRRRFVDHGPGLLSLDAVHPVVWPNAGRAVGRSARTRKPRSVRFRGARAPVCAFAHGVKVILLNKSRKLPCTGL